MKKSIVFAIIFIAIVAAIIYVNTDHLTSYTVKYEGTDLTHEVEGVSKDNTYNGYLLEHSEKGTASCDVEILLDSYTGSGDISVLSEFEGRSGCIYTGDESEVTFTVEVPESGFYNLYLDYYAVEARGVDVERQVLINGEVPYSDADNLVFTRMWKDNGESVFDNQGNEIRPEQSEVFGWQSSYFKDSMGYQRSPLLFYFECGSNTVSLTAVSEPMVIGALKLAAVKDSTGYTEYLASQPKVAESDTAEEYIQVIQGEAATLRSSASLYARYDRASAITEPYDVYHTILNCIGGTAWNQSGQWIEWEFTVPEDGYYNISVKGRQNFQRGNISSRLVYIDGEIPFTEGEKIDFEYGNEWTTKTISDEDGNPYNYYLTAGTHTIRLEANLGDMGAILEEISNSIFRLNTIYRTILVLTGASPDEFRTYHIDTVYPQVMDAMLLESKRLYKILDDTISYTGQKSDKIASALTLATQLEDFCDDPDEITKRFVAFRDNITALSTSLQSLSETKLDIDLLVISGTKAEIPAESNNFIKKAVHEIRSFIASYTVDYNSLGDVYDEDEAITVWISTGRDQSNVLKRLVDDSFTSASGIGINLKLVNQNALLSAVTAGNGPDIVLSIDSVLPVDYALRNAVEDLTQFDDLDEVLGSFKESAYSAFKFNNGLYALPETQTYNLLFYRKDIMEELGLEVPTTWEDVINIMPTIQGKNMMVGIHNTNIGVLYSMIYQNGGTIYNESGSRTALDSEAGIKAFETFTSFYNDYGIPIVFDFVSRFRSGEMPIGVADYTTFNTLAVSAPEIRGLWDFTVIPGTAVYGEDGTATIDHSVHTTGVCCIMLKNEDEAVRNKAWEFMKWWVSADTQVSFGREMECILGSSARYATANLEAFSQLSWSSHQIKVLTEQLNWSVGYHEVAGGYYTSRHVNNAIRKVINEKENARETLIDYARTINEELTKKRQEFGLPVDE